MLQRSHFVALHSVTVALSQTCVAYYNRVVHKGEILPLISTARTSKKIPTLLGLLMTLTIKLKHL